MINLLYFKVCEELYLK